MRIDLLLILDCNKCLLTKLYSVCSLETNCFSKMLWNSKNFLVHSIELDIFAQCMCFSKFCNLALSCSAAEVLTSFVLLHWWSAIASFQYAILKDDGHDLWLCRLWKQSVTRISPKMSKYTNWINDLFYLRSCFNSHWKRILIVCLQSCFNRHWKWILIVYLQSCFNCHWKWILIVYLQSCFNRHWKWILIVEDFFTLTFKKIWCSVLYVCMQFAGIVKDLWNVEMGISWYLKWLYIIHLNYHHGYLFDFLLNDIKNKELLPMFFFEVLLW